MTTLGILNLSVVGEASYQRALKSARRFAKSQPLYVRLKAEPRNQYDKNAVRVDVLLGWRKPTVGYLSRSDAKKYQQLVRKAKEPVVLPAKLFGGTREKRHLGIGIGEDFAQP